MQQSCKLSPLVGHVLVLVLVNESPRERPRSRARARIPDVRWRTSLWSPVSQLPIVLEPYDRPNDEERSRSGR
jgi:hypothetical protein